MTLRLTCLAVVLACRCHGAAELWCACRPGRPTLRLSLNRAEEEEEGGRQERRVAKQLQLRPL
jgi:hypothetical protein